MTTDEKIKEELEWIVKQTGIEISENLSESMLAARNEENVYSSLEEISSLIPKWRTQDDKLPDDDMEVQFFLNTDVIFNDLPDGYDRPKIGNWDYRSETFNYYDNNKLVEITIKEIRYWIPESELLNLIPKP